MEFSWDRYHGVTKRFALLAGQWPYQDKNEKLFRMSLVMTALLVINVPQVCMFFRCGTNLECITRTLPPYILVLVVMLKLYLGQFRSNKIKVLTDYVFVNWESLQNPEEHEIMKIYVASARWVVIMYSAVCLSGVTLFISVSLVPHILDVVLPLNESRPIVLPFEAYYFVDERKYFFYIFFQAFVSGEIGIIGLVAYDVLFMTLVEHVCGVFTVAGFRFEHLTTCREENVEKIVNGDLDIVYSKRMACCVNIHRAALEFAEHLENTFSINFGIELILVTIVLSLTLFQVTTQLDHIVEALRLVTYVFAQLVHLFVFCWEGQRLIDHSLKMHDKMYNCIWYKIPAKSQRLLLHVLKRSLRPKFLSAGRMFVFSLQGFTTVVQTSMSYFTVLSSV